MNDFNRLRVKLHKLTKSKWSGEAWELDMVWVHCIKRDVNDDADFYGTAGCGEVVGVPGNQVAFFYFYHGISIAAGFAVCKWYFGMYLRALWYFFSRK